jgi:uridylate kinase
MRVLLKVSGEALAGEKWSGLDYVMLDKVCDMIKEITEKNIEVAIVVWAWNFIRWAEIEKINIDRCNADNMGMLAININAIALADVLVRKWIEVRQVNSFAIDWISERFNKPKTIKSLKKWHVVIFGWGTGNPYFTTDTAGVLRALEIEADMMIKATKVDWVYDKDPIRYSDAIFIKNATYDEVITKNLKVMDATSIALAKENSMLVKVVSLYKKDAVINAIIWDEEWTIIHDK